MKSFPKFLFCVLLLVLAIKNSYTQEVTDTNTPQHLSQAELENFLDPYILHELKSNHIPGAVIAIVSHGQILLVKGYGFSNIENKEHVKRNTTFRLGSITKLFTTTAILQLVEQGKLKLNDDVNQYLKSFQIVNAFPEPVRVSNLLTHTAGFDERNLGIS